MASSPRTVGDYTGEQLQLVRRTLSQLVTALSDLVDQEKIVVVGGLVPSLLVPSERLPAGALPHPGTMDLDLGLAVGLRREASYRDLAARLRQAGFAPASTEAGHQTHQTWRFQDASAVDIDFLMAPEPERPEGGDLRRFRGGLAASAIPGLHLAFMDQERLQLSDTNFDGASVTRTVSVCGAGAFVVLKALAFRGRNNPKDAYDLHFVVRYYGETFIDDVASRIRPLMGDPHALQAMGCLEEDFARIDSTGPGAIARFLRREGDVVLLDQVVGDIGLLLQKIGDGSSRSGEPEGEPRTPRRRRGRRENGSR